MYFRSLFTPACLVGTAMTLRIMPLGDSITDITCWRANLWDVLATNNVTSNVTFVGSMTTNKQNCVATQPNYDLHHEGHSSYLAIDIAANNLTGWLASAQPDVVNFMLGTNDVTHSYKTDEIIAAYTKLVQEMRANNPNMKIIIDTIISLPKKQGSISAVNAAIPAWAQAQNTTASPIFVADVAAVFPLDNSDLRDGVHPNAAGDAVIANALAPVWTWVIQST